MLGTNEHFKSMDMVFVTWCCYVRCTEVGAIYKYVCMRQTKDENEMKKRNEIAFLEEMRIFLQSTVLIKYNKESCMFRRASIMYSRWRVKRYSHYNGFEKALFIIDRMFVVKLWQFVLVKNRHFILFRFKIQLNAWYECEWSISNENIEYFLSLFKSCEWADSLIAERTSHWDGYMNRHLSSNYQNRSKNLKSLIFSVVLTYACVAVVFE